MEWIKRLQNKPYKTKIKIMWVTVGIIMTGVIILWLLTLSFDSSRFLNISKLFEGIIK